MVRRRLMPLAVLLAGAAGANAGEIVTLEQFGTVIRRSTSADGSPHAPQAIKGVATDPFHVGRVFAIDTRPANGALYALAAGRLYELDVASGWATPVGPHFLDADDSTWAQAAMDFDPVADVLWIGLPAGARAGMQPPDPRLFRVDPDTGQLLDAAVDTIRLQYHASEFARLAAIRGFSIAHPAAGGTAPGAPALYGVDCEQNSLIRIEVPGAAPADALLRTVAPLTGLPIGLSTARLDIAPDGTALLFDARGASDVFSVDLSTGAVTLVERLPKSRSIVDIAFPPTAPRHSLQLLDVTRETLRIDFRRRKRSVLELRGTLPAPPDGWDGQTVRVRLLAGLRDVTPMSHDFVLDARGRSRAGGWSFAVQKEIQGGQVPFVLRLTGAALNPVAIDPSTPSQPFTSSVDLLVDGQAFRDFPEMNFVAGRRRGTATLAR